MLLQIYKSKETKLIHEDSIILAGDIGATKSNLGLFKIKGDSVTSLREKKFITKEFDSIKALTEDFLKGAISPDAICFGVAGPVLNGIAKLSNIHWEIDNKDLSNYFHLKKVHLINDLEATAYGLAMLHEEDIVDIYPGDIHVQENAAIIAPGTGLGEAGLYWDGKCYRPFATEGGHCDFAPRNHFDFDLYTFLQKKFGHVSWERLVCGPGIVNIYTFLRDVKNMNEEDWLKEKLKQQDAAAVISSNVNDSLLCKETMQYFIRYLAYESANLILKCKATSGLYIGGGIAPQIISLFENNTFRSFLCQSGRLNYLLEDVPVKIILNPKAALLGAAYYGYVN